MAVMTMGAFMSGLAVGWAGRGLSSSAPREEAVRAVEAGFHAYAAVRRWVTRSTEWLEDVFAEGRARYEASLERAAAAGEAGAPEAAPVIAIVPEGHAA